MYEIRICPIKQLISIAKEADMSNVAVLMVTSYEEDLEERREQLKGCYAVSVHSFLDITAAGRDRSFGEKAAGQIRDYVVNLPMELDTLFVCCDSGQSRSTAMAAAILRYFALDETVIWGNPAYHPNPLVYRTLCKAFWEPVSQEELEKLQQINEEALKRAIWG